MSAKRHYGTTAPRAKQRNLSQREEWKGALEGLHKEGKLIYIPAAQEFDGARALRGGEAVREFDASCSGILI